MGPGRGGLWLHTWATPLDSTQDILHIGRGTDAQIRIEHHLVSRDHAILVHHGRYWRLLDNRSSNGTFVNGRRIAAMTLSDGDLIDLGPVRIQLVEVR